MPGNKILWYVLQLSLMPTCDNTFLPSEFTSSSPPPGPPIRTEFLNPSRALRLDPPIRLSLLKSPSSHIGLPERITTPKCREALQFVCLSFPHVLSNQDRCSMSPTQCMDMKSVFISGQACGDSSQSTSQIGGNQNFPISFRFCSSFDLRAVFRGSSCGCLIYQNLRLG